MTVFPQVLVRLAGVMTINLQLPVLLHLLGVALDGERSYIRQRISVTKAKKNRSGEA